MFDPKCDKYPYPIETDKHYLIVKKDDGTIFDENYPYIDNSKGFKFKQFWVRVLLRSIVFPLTKVRMGLKIKGRKILKKHKDLLKNGVISISNHIHMWDYIGVMKAIRPVKPNLLVWAKNISGESGPLVRLVGGIPIPENNLKATFVYLKAVENLLNNGGWLHIYPEGSMWEYYRPIRPFKVGAFHLAIEHNKPILPLAYSYRKPNWIRRKIFHQIALLTLTIGEPLFKDETLSRSEQEKDLLIRSHESVIALSHSTKEENLYEPIFHKSTRVDYYTNIYGINYKGSK